MVKIYLNDVILLLLSSTLRLPTPALRPKGKRGLGTNKPKLKIGLDNKPFSGPVTNGFNDGFIIPGIKAGNGIGPRRPDGP